MSSLANRDAGYRLFTSKSVNASYKGDLFYTVDDLAVHKLHVSNFPRSFNEKILQNHFKKFGTIKSINIGYEKKDNKTIPYAFIQFKWAKCATHALKEKHEIQNSLLDVKAAESWEQPSYKQFNVPLHTEKNENITNKLLELNFDCQFYLFSFLSLKEKVKLTNAFPTLKPVFEQSFKAKKRTLNLNEHDVTFLEIREILKEYGHLIENFSLHYRHLSFYHNDNNIANRGGILTVLSNFCTNLKQLDLVSILRISPNDISNLKNLEKVRLVGCDIKDEIFLILCKLPNIRELDLTDNRYICGKNLYRLKKLQHLSLSLCENVEPIHLIKMCKSLKELKTLNITGCMRLDEPSMKAIGEYLLSLEGLAIDTIADRMSLREIVQLKNLKSLSTFSSNIINDLSESKNCTLEKLSVTHGAMDAIKLRAIAEITSIKELCFSYDESINDEFLKMISNSTTLEFLEVSDCRSITKSGVISLVKTSISLKYLDISSNLQFYDDLVYDTIDALKTAAKYKTITFIIGQTNIGRHIALDPKYTGQDKLILCEQKYESYIQNSMLSRTNYNKYKKWTAGA